MNTHVGTPRDIESPYAWTRLAVSLLLMTIGGAGMYSVAVVLPRIQAEFAVARGDLVDQVVGQRSNVRHEMGVARRRLARLDLTDSGAIAEGALAKRRADRPGDLLRRPPANADSDPAYDKFDASK